jgi:FemAB-related protein (PEP-CTERM system-associated)
MIAETVAVREAEIEAPALTSHPSPLSIRALTPELAPAWDAYVAQAPHGLPQHRAGWQNVLAQTYGYETRFIMAVEASEADAPRIRGVLPLFLTPGLILGQTATTTPGGLCADNEEAAALLIAHGQEIAQTAGAKRFVLHDSRHAHPGLSACAAHEARMIDLRAGREAVWKGLDRNVRRQVRMAERNGVRVVIDRTGARLGDFYEVISRFTHLAGTPVFPRRFLENVIEEFPGGVHLALAYHEGRPMGGYFQLALGQTLYGAWGAALPEALPLRTVYLAYWEIMADAMEQGFAALDMGRSPTGSNAAKYKAQWGGMTTPVYQLAWQPCANGAAPTIGTQAQQDARFRAFRRLWPILPYRVAQWLGPAIRRHVPFG